MNTAQLYLDLQLRPLTTALMMLGKEPKTVPTLGRTPEEAQECLNKPRLLSARAVQEAGISPVCSTGF